MPDLNGRDDFEYVLEVVFDGKFYKSRKCTAINW
jgi:hypothetical protein